MGARVVGRAAALVAAAFLAATALGQDRKPAVERVEAEVISATYQAIILGEAHYFEEEYAQALPHLLLAAERGFKEAQSQVGWILVNGLGGVQKDVAQGIAWLGVAASGNSRPGIVEVYDNVMSSIPEQHRAALGQIVEQFRSMYDGRLTRVACEFNRRDGIGRDALRCRFLDELLYPEIRRARGD